MTQQARTPFSTDAGEELPLGMQLSWRLRALILTGQLQPGERLPSIRRLSDWAGVNVGTVRSVYDGLEAEGLVVTRHGQGSFVSEDVEPAPELEEIVAEALERASAAGYDARDLAIVAMACAAVPEEPAEPSAAEGELPDLDEDSEVIEVRRELRRQIAQLEAQLAGHTRHLQADLPTAPRRAVPHVAGVEELEQTRDTLIAQLAEAERETERKVRLQARSRGPLGRAMSRWRSRN